MDSVEYLGHQVNQSGIQTYSNMIEAISNATTTLTDVQEVCSFLGLLNYYGNFIHTLATITHPSPLGRQEMELDQQMCSAFQLAKQQFTSVQVLTLYDPRLPINLAADASAYGVGAIISHIFLDGFERCIAFVSRTLSTSERNHTQIEKEALSLIFGVKRFHQYLHGRKFSLITGHKLLIAIFGPKKNI